MHHTIEHSHGLHRPLVAHGGPQDATARRPLRRILTATALAEMPVTENSLNRHLAEEIDYVRRQIEALGDEISSDPLILRRHMVSLQAFDRVAQVLGHLAAVTRSSNPVATVDAIGMTELKARLQRRSL